MNKNHTHCIHFEGTDHVQPHILQQQARPIAAMTAFVALSTQFTSGHTHAASIAYDGTMIEIA